MIRKHILFIGYTFFLSLHLVAQNVVYIDTVPTKSTYQYLQLKVHIPTGEVFMQSSGLCGQSVSHFSCPTQDRSKPRVRTYVNSHGVPQREISMTERAPGSGPNTAQTSDHFKDGLWNNQYTYKACYNPDPNIPTELVMDLGRGRSRLDFSDLSLTNVIINTAFSDVTLTYSSANKAKMEQMKIHAAKAKIILKNPEYARADLISIQNDMGDTKVILGNGHHPGSTIFVQAGMGGCMLILHKNHPVKIVVRKGLLAGEEIPPNFVKIAKNEYANAAYQRYPKRATTFICNIDFGNLLVIEN